MRVNAAVRPKTGWRLSLAYGLEAEISNRPNNETVEEIEGNSRQQLNPSVSPLPQTAYLLQAARNRRRPAEAFNDDRPITEFGRCVFANSDIISG